MRAANKALVLAAAAAVAALSACGQHDAGNTVIANNAAASTDIERLPADESSATPTGDLVNGVDDTAPSADNIAEQ